MPWPDRSRIEGVETRAIGGSVSDRAREPGAHPPDATLPPVKPALALASALLASTATLARADLSGVTFDPPAPPPAEAPAVEAPPRAHAEERPFAYVLDPSTPSRGDASAEYRVGLASGVAAARPLPATIAPPGIVHALTLGYGVTARIAPFAGVEVLPGTSLSPETRTAASAGARVQLTDPRGPFRLTLAGALMRDFGGAFGGYGRLAASYDVQRLRIAGNLHAEKFAAEGRDALDVLAFAGASYRALDVLRLGVEYVGQDLEDAVEAEEAEGGAKHFLGPTAALDLGGGAVQIVGGPAFGLDARSPRAMGRVAMLVSF